ncbi:hypothetical protein MPTK1_6g15970 [Marchantia polymorpha subsp. ruderalis]|uniref:Uncharacterized protein n=2 Tax=Marchantia polymorpha TaxID=3197 RepID=A0AAF6BSJ4_MARPO|nr:hypothetical protein MARPO_0056s0109 [Marchantia polymorpha]BBN14978.1 hypothetical protein Mp_6g15970 [Marchantia polymorpha subsp. ruderalis]|eukprot:PTQ37662.1 hypothetical protein MARPO_0056s0109 [Marchantia polymorpha]
MQVSLEENLKGHIALSLQFIMDLFSEAQTSSKTKQFSAYIHQSVKFIKECIIQLIDKGAEDKYSVQEMVKKFTSSLSIKIMNHISDEGPDARVWIQQTSYQLGSLPCFGHQLLFIISKLIAEVTETLVCLNPFHEGAAQTYENLYFLYQLFEKIVADYLCEWANTGDLDIEVLTNTFERHFSTVRHLMKFPNWGSLIVQYNTKLTGEIVAQLSTAVCINHYAEESQQTALLNLLELAKHATTDVT